MALTQIRKEQLRDGIITNDKVHATAGIDYSKLDLAGSIVATDLNANATVEQAALNYKLIALWDATESIASGTGSSVVVEELVTNAAAVDTFTTTGTAKGVLLSGTGAAGAGTQNYKVQIRNTATKESISDGSSPTPGGGEVYGELRNAGSSYVLYFFKENGDAYTFATSVGINIMFLEVMSLLDVPLKGFTTGTAFADLSTGITGTHNHDDRYYTETNLDAGQLDNRYYTETELGNGQLDSRYYTETELSPSASQGDNVLDARFYTESELGAVSATSGASLIGVDATALPVTDPVGGYATVQAAIGALDGRLDTLETAGGVTQSLDDAYDDGSTITVDTAAVTWKLTDTKIFDVTDASAVSIFKVSALSGGDTVEVVGETILDKTGVDGDFSVVASGVGETIVLNAGTNALNIDAGTTTIDGTGISIDGTSASNFTVTAGNLTVSTITSGTIALDSAGVLTLKDSAMDTAMTMSQTNATAFSAEFGYDQQSQFDWTNRDIGTVAVSSLLGAVNANRQDLYEYIELLVTTGAPFGTAAGANLIGVDGLTGIIPTGETVPGTDSNLQAMMEGLAANSGGLKNFANEADFIDAKEAGTYFPQYALVHIRDTDRFAIIVAQGTGAIESVDWDYLWGASRPFEGKEFVVNTSGTGANITLDTTGNLNIDVDAGVTIDENSGAHFGLTTAGQVDIDSAAGQKVQVDSDTEIELNGGAGVVDINAATVTIDGTTTVTAPVNTNVTLATTGTGIIDITSSEEIDLTGGNIDINSGAGKVVTIDSDTKITATSAVEVEINGGTVDINSGTGLPITLDSDTLVSIAGGVEVDLTATTIDMNGVVDMDGASATFTTSGAFTVQATTDVDIGGDTVDLTASGASIGLDTAGKITATSVDGQEIELNSDTALDLNGGALVDVTATVINLNGEVNMTIPVNSDATIATTGTGEVSISSETAVTIDAPATFVTGDVTMDSDNWLTVGNIKINSVGTEDSATITGSRTGTPNTANKLLNSGFEAGVGTGAGSTATSWAYAAGVTRSEYDRYYGSYATKVVTTDLAANLDILEQDTTSVGLTANAIHNVSFYVKGVVGGQIDATLNGGDPVKILDAGTYATWTRVNVDLGADNAATGDFLLTAYGSGTEDYNFYIDAVMLKAGTGVANYFSTTQSELIFTIGDDDDDRIVMRSQGTSTTDLVRINQDGVEILGNLSVTGTTTTVNTTELLITDNEVILNSGATGSATLDAFLTVERGTDDNTAIKWNESLNQWELTNDGTNFAAIVTSSGSAAISMDSAYDGGSSVTVDSTNVNFALASTKSFIVSDVSDASKLIITAGAGASSVKIDTTGGVDIDVAAGFTLNENSGAAFAITTLGAVTLDAATTKSIILTSDTLLSLAGGTETDITATTIDINGILDVDGASADVLVSGAISLDAGGNSNFTATEGSLTLSTVTSGNMIISSAGTLTASATGNSSLAITSGNLDFSTVTSGNITLTAAASGDVNIDSDLDLNADFIQNGGAYTFLVGTTDTSADSIKFDTAGGMVIEVDGVLDINNTGGLDLDGLSVDMDTTAGISLDAATASNFTVAGNDLTLSTTTTGDVIINAGSDIDMDADNVTITTSAAFDISGAAESTVTVAGADLNLTTTASGSIVIGSIGGVTVDGTGISIDGTSASNLSVTGNTLTLSTLGSTGTRTLAISSAGELTFDDQHTSTAIAFADAANTTLPGSATSILGALHALDDAQTANDTFDEIFDNEPAVTRVISQTDGSVQWNITDTYSHIFADSAAATILSIEADATANEVNVVAAFDVTGDTTLDKTTIVGDLTQSTGVILLQAGAANNVTISGDEMFVDGTSISIDTAGASNFTATGANLTVSTATSGTLFLTSAGLMDIDAGASADIDVTGNLEIDTTGTFSVDGVGASNVTTNNGNLTIAQTGTGSLLLSAAGEADITAASFDVNLTGAISIDAAATSYIKTTTGNLTLEVGASGGELYFDDARTTAIPFSDATYYELPAGTTSVLGAIKAAFSSGSEMQYEQVVVDSDDVGFDYVVVSMNALPVSLTNYTSPASLRSNGYFLATYLNGMRLADAEFNYVYANSERRIVFNGSGLDNITLVIGDMLVFELTYTTPYAAAPTPPATTPVAFESGLANGSTGTVTTTQLTLTFDVDPTAALTAGNIALTGATKGTLTGTGLTRTLAISAITVLDGETVNVAITNPIGFTITPSDRDIQVWVA